MKKSGPEKKSKDPFPNYPSENEPIPGGMKVEEITPAYSGKKLRFFSGFEEENEFVYQLYAKMTPEERLDIVNAMRIRICPVLEKPDLNVFGKRLIFKKCQE